MLFNSVGFILFASLFYATFSFFKNTHSNSRWLLIVIASFIFYGWWDWRYLSLIVLSGLIDFIAALVIVQKPEYKRLLLTLSLGSNLLILAIFKYAYFFCGGITALANAFFGSEVNCTLPTFFAVLPIGISFYTFQSMSYTIDVYYGRLKPTRNVLHFFAFLSFFPQLVAGPIVRAGDLLPQLKNSRPVTESMRWHGLKLIAIGYFKKTVLADNIGPFINNAFANETTNSSSAFWWVVMLGFTFQIYCDFSGYSDIARGLAKWMGIHFRVNFNHPYIATSFRNFWQRWHISLSTWFRDYVYKPLGGSKGTDFSAYVNMWITMLVSGLWHGAGITFIIWGAIHALYLTMERLAKKFLKFSFPAVITMPLVFIAVVLAWVFFRANSWQQAVDILHHLLSFNTKIEWSNEELFHQAVYFIILCLCLEFLFIPQRYLIAKFRRRSWMRWLDLLIVVMLLVGSIFLRGTAAQFVYFQF